MKASAQVLRMDPELLIFPLLSGIAVLAVSTTFILPLALMGDGLEGLSDGGGYLGYVVAFLYYLVMYTVVFFFNTALVGAAMIRLEGGDPTVRDGMEIGFNKLGAILEYAAIAATVGMILRALEERAGFIGRIVIGFLGIGWSLATYLAVPVLVTKDVSAFDAVKESAALFRKTWGEQVAGNAGIGLATFVVLMIMTAAAVPLFLLASAASPALTVAVGISLAGGYLCIILVSSALNGIYCTALYRYATLGDPGRPFSPEMMRAAFRPRRRKW